MSEQAEMSARVVAQRDSGPDGGGAPPPADAAFARWLADRAGRLLLQIRADMGHADAAALKAAGDKAAHDLLRAELARWRPADAVLSEEDAQSREVRPGADRLDAGRVWIIDPLDGTREFSEAGRTDWAVHVALWTADGTNPSCLAAGAVAMPAQHRTIATDHPPAYPPMPLGDAGTPIRIAASRTRPPAFVQALAEETDADLVPMGSAGVKVMSVVRDLADAYVHAGGQYQWDNAAPVAVARAAGLHCSRVDGSPLVYNRADTLVPDLIVARADLAQRVLAFTQR
jgi:3'(2'), 5'-bisphosphate nucleotidase